MLPIFVPTRDKRAHTIFNYRKDVIACINVLEYNKYASLGKVRILRFMSRNIQEKRRAIQEWCIRYGVDKIFMVDDDVVIDPKKLVKLEQFAQDNDFAFACYSNSTCINRPFQTTPCMYLDFARLPKFRTENMFEDLCMVFDCLDKGVPVGSLSGKIIYFYKMGENSHINNRTERALNTVKMFPQYAHVCHELIQNQN